MYTFLGIYVCVRYRSCSFVGVSQQRVCTICTNTSTWHKLRARAHTHTHTYTHTKAISDGFVTKIFHAHVRTRAYTLTHNIHTLTHTKAIIYDFKAATLTHTHNINMYTHIKTTTHGFQKQHSTYIHTYTHTHKRRNLKAITHGAFAEQFLHTEVDAAAKVRAEMSEWSAGTTLSQIALQILANMLINAAEEAAEDGSDGWVSCDEDAGGDEVNVLVCVCPVCTSCLWPRWLGVVL
jgi:hypothetical protein